MTILEIDQSYEQQTFMVEVEQPAHFFARNEKLIAQTAAAIDEYELSRDKLDTERALGRLSEEELSLFGVSKHELKRDFMSKVDPLARSVATELCDDSVITINGKETRRLFGSIAQAVRAGDETDGYVIFGNYEIPQHEFDRGYRYATEDDWRVLLLDMSLEAKQA